MAVSGGTLTSLCDGWQYAKLARNKASTAKRGLELSCSTIGPADWAHHRAERRHGADQRQHGEPHKQEKPCSHVLEENVVHDASFTLL